jgi:DNA-binding NtrC family response regulator
VPHKVNVRLISATNKDLIEEVKAGRFREDLYYRLNVFPITMPALRRRKEDIPHLVRVFVERFSAEQKIGHQLGISAATMGLLTAYDWPGNIRQLENAIFRAVVLSQGPELLEADFPQIAAQLPGYLTPDHLAMAADGRRPMQGEGGLTVVGPSEPPSSENTSHGAAFASYPAAESVEFYGPDNIIASTGPSGDVRKLADVEEELIRFALKFYRGQMSQVARKLGIGRSTLYRKLKDYGIDPDDPQKHAA